MAYVTCKYCREKFDRAKESFVKIPTGQTCRYAHEKCYLEQQEKDNSLNYEIINPLDIVQCVFCKKQINKNAEEYVMIQNGKYAHKDCAQKEQERPKTELEILYEYIMKLFNFTYVPPRIKKQIETYKIDYDFTYSGILKSLIYFYEIQGHSIDLANGGISIVPYVYTEAKNYFYKLFLLNSINKDENISEYIPKEIEVHISPPSRKIYSQNKFSILEE